MDQLVCYVCCDNCRLVSNDHISNYHILLLQECLYNSFFFSRRDTEQSNIWSLSPNNLSLSFLIKKLIFVRARALVFRRFGDPFAAHDRNQQVVVSWKRSTIKFFPINAVGYFLSKNSVYALQPRLYFSFPNLFFHLLYVIMRYSCAVN